MIEAGSDPMKNAAPKLRGGVLVHMDGAKRS